MEETNEKIDVKEDVKSESKKGPNPATVNKTIEGEIIRDKKPKSGKYKGKDKIAVKHNLTEKQKAFVDEFIKSRNATAAYRAAKGTLANKEEWIAADRPNGCMLKENEKIKAYLREKVILDAEECLEIQMDMIRNEKTPAAVRNDAIKDRLNRSGVFKEEQDSGEIGGIGEITITIKHKQPEVLDGVIVEDDGKDIQS